MGLPEKVATVPHWRHRIPLPGGSITPGSQDTAWQLERLQLPADMTGLSVLDVGCSDGFFSFECERRGAARVLAVDNFSSVYIDTPRGFHVARELLNSQVEYLQADLFSLTPAEIGQFDIVLFLGVLYHLRHPLLAIERLAALCKRQFIMETEIAEPPRGIRARLFSAFTGYKPNANWMQFFPGEELNRDPTNWWAPTVECCEAMLRSCGFCGVKTVFGGPWRGMFHAFAPHLTDDPQKLIANFGADNVAKACGIMLKTTVSPADVIAAVKNLSIPQYASLNQTLLEDRAKQWHQVEKWKQ